MDLGALSLALTDPFWLVAFALLPPLIVLGLWEGKTVRTRRSALGLARASGDRWRPRVGTALRAAILSLVLLALAGLQMVQASGPLTVVYLVDKSDSVSEAQVAAARAYIASGLQGMGAEDKAGVVLFGAHATAERLPSNARTLADFTTTPPGDGSNIAEAIRLGLALLPAEGRRRLVLISDGGETSDDSREQARLLDGQGVQLDVVPYTREARNEVSVEAVAAPDTIPLGQSFTLKIAVQSTTAQGVNLSILEDGVAVDQRSVQLAPGENLFEQPVTPKDKGFHRYSARVAAVDDRWAANNEAASYTVVQGEPKVLIVADDPADGEPLRVALAAAHVDAKLGAPIDIPTDMQGISTYDSIVLANVPATDIPADTQKLLQVFVRDLGRGLMMIGGENSFGSGGYFSTPIEELLPVSMAVRSSARDADLALALVVDKSGSMGRCHCGDSAAFRSTDVRESGVAKVDIAKDAIVKAAASLAPTDKIGVVAFDSLARWVVQLEPVSQVPDIKADVAGIAADGDTNIFTGLQAAVDALQASSARIKHIILLTDGWSMQGNFDALTTEMQQDKITLSAIGAGGGSAELLQGLAHSGGGRFYAAPDINSVPQLFFDETMIAAGSYLIEQPSAPERVRGSPILKGMENAALPSVLGYNATTAKDTAETILKSPEGDPLLAQWQYGLGRAVAWTSDMKGRWATNWVAWPQFATFASQMVGWTLPRSSANGIEMNISDAVGGGKHIAIDSTASNGTPRDFLQTSVTLVAPDLTSSEADLQQVGPGEYAGDISTGPPGSYALQLTQTDQNGQVVASQLSGLVVPYSAEYKLDRPAAAADQLLSDLANAAGGREMNLDAPGEAFAAGAPSLPARTPLWPWLLALAAVLFPIDIAVRRLTMTRGDIGRFFHAIRSGEFLQRPQPVPAAVAVAPVAPIRITEVNSEGEREDVTPPPAIKPRSFGLGKTQADTNSAAMWPGGEYESSMRSLQEQRQRARRQSGEQRD